MTRERAEELLAENEMVLVEIPSGEIVALDIGEVQCRERMFIVKGRETWASKLHAHWRAAVSEALGIPAF